MADGDGGLSLGDPSFTVTSDDSGRVVAKFSYPHAPQGVDVKPLLYRIARVLRASFAANIDSGGRPTFAPLAPSTLKEKARLGYSPLPLVRTTLLRNAVARRGARGNVTYVSAAGVLSVGVSVRYAAVQQEGGGPSGIPARPFVTLQDSDWDAISALQAQFESTGGDMAYGPDS